MADQQGLAAQLFGSLRRGWRLVIAVTIMVATLCLAIVVNLPHLYKASSEVTIETQTPEAVPLGQVLRDPPTATDMLGTEIQLIRSDDILGQTIKTLGLDKNPLVNPDLRKSGGPSLLQPIKDWLHRGLPQVSEQERHFADTLSALRRRLAITPLPESRVVQITFWSPDREIAAAVANTIAQTYIRAKLATREQLINQAHSWISEKLGNLREQADQAAKAVESYRIAHGMTSVPSSAGKALLIQQQIAEVSSQLANSRHSLFTLQAQESAARQAAASGEIEQLSAVLASPTIARLREQEAAVSAQRASLLARYSPDSPVLSSIDAQYSAIRRTISAEARRLVSSLQSSLAAAKADDQALQARLNQLVQQSAAVEMADPALQQIMHEADAEQKMYINFLTRANETSFQFPAVNAQIISAAIPPVSPAWPPLPMLLPAIAVGSLSIGSAAAVLWDRRRRGFLSVAQLEASAGATGLGLIPLYGRSALSKQIYEDAIDQLWNRVMSSAAPPRTLLVASACSGEGKSTTALALARSGAERGQKILLINADLRTTPHERTQGFGDVLRGVPAAPAIRESDVPNLSILSAGAIRRRPTQLFATPAVRRVLDHLLLMFDVIVIDSPPTLIGGDAEALAAAADQTVFLARWGHTAPEHVAFAVRRLVSAGAKLSGVVLSMVDPSKNAKYAHADAVLFSRTMRAYYQ